MNSKERVYAALRFQSYIAKKVEFERSRIFIMMKICVPVHMDVEMCLIAYEKQTILKKKLSFHETSFA